MLMLTLMLMHRWRMQSRIAVLSSCQLLTAGERPRARWALNSPCLSLLCDRRLEHVLYRFLSNMKIRIVSQVHDPLPAVCISTLTGRETKHRLVCVCVCVCMVVKSSFLTYVKPVLYDHAVMYFIYHFVYLYLPLFSHPFSAVLWCTSIGSVSVISLPEPRIWTCPVHMLFSPMAQPSHSP